MFFVPGGKRVWGAMDPDRVARVLVIAAATWNFER